MGNDFSIKVNKVKPGKPFKADLSDEERQPVQSVSQISSTATPEKIKPRSGFSRAVSGFGGKIKGRIAVARKDRAEFKAEERKIIKQEQLRGVQQRARVKQEVRTDKLRSFRSSQRKRFSPSKVSKSRDATDFLGGGTQSSGVFGGNGSSASSSIFGSPPSRRRGSIKKGKRKPKSSGGIFGGGSVF